MVCVGDLGFRTDPDCLATHRIGGLQMRAQRSGHRGPPPRHPEFVSPTSLVARAVSPLTRPPGRPYDRFSTCRPKGPPARRTIGFQPVGPRAHRPVESQSLDSPPQTTPHQVSAPRAVGRTRPFDNPKNWPHQSTAAGPLLQIDSPLSLLSPLGLRPPDPQRKTHAPAPAQQNVSRPQTKPDTFVCPTGQSL